MNSFRGELIDRNVRRDLGKVPERDTTESDTTESGDCTRRLLRARQSKTASRDWFVHCSAVPNEIAANATQQRERTASAIHAPAPHLTTPTHRMEHELRQFTAPPPAYTSCGQPVPPRANPLFGPGSRSALRAAGRLVKRATKPAGKQPASEDDEDELGAGPALVKELQTIRPYSRKKGCGWTKDEDKLLTDAVAICELRPRCCVY